MTSLAINILAYARMGIGAASLVAPLPVCSAFLLPVAPVATLAIRLAGARDFAVGGLLWHAARKHQEVPVGDVKEQQPLVAKTNTRSSKFLRSALTAGIVVDAIDILSVAACFADGTVPLDGAVVFAGGAAAFVGLGAWALRGIK
jgi:hypothetical protein